MDKVVNVSKPVSVTPLQVVEKFREKNPDLKKEKIGYAGRLDPMAGGVMLLLIGEENKNRKKYLSLDKVYRFKVLFGVSTDTYDILGLVENQANYVPDAGYLSDLVNASITSYIGKFVQEYPPYSTKTVNGKPLFKWAREGKINEISMPVRDVEVYDLKLLSTQTFSLIEVQTSIFERVKMLEGDFRQDQILRSWDAFFKVYNQDDFVIAEFEIHCSTGTYVRSLAHRLGEKLGVHAIAYDILRTKVGNFNLRDALTDIF